MSTSLAVLEVSLKGATTMENISGNIEKGIPHEIKARKCSRKEPSGYAAPWADN
jgi:hypothetical protein